MLSSSGDPFLACYGVKIGLGLKKKSGGAYLSSVYTTGSPARTSACSSSAWLTEVPFEGREKSELPHRKDDVMYEKRVGGVLDRADDVGGSSAAACETTVGKETVSLGVRSDICDDMLDERRNGSIAIFRWVSRDEHHRDHVSGV